VEDGDRLLLLMCWGDMTARGLKGLPKKGIAIESVGGVSAGAVFAGAEAESGLLEWTGSVVVGGGSRLKVLALERLVGSPSSLGLLLHALYGTVLRYAWVWTLPTRRSEVNR